MFTPIKIEILGDPNPQGGRRSVTSSLDVKVVWDESVKERFGGRAGRYGDLGVSVKVTMLFTQARNLAPGKCRVIKDGKTYSVVDVIPAVSSEGLGLNGTYDLMLSEYKEKTS